jgi:hypothetical protein
MSKETLPVDVEKAFEAMRNIPAPNPAHQLAARQAFLAQARQMRQAQTVSGNPATRHREQRFRQRIGGSLMMTMAKVAMVLLILSGAATGTAFAADASLPGQPLYPLDLQMEQAQTMLATTAEAQNNLSLGLAAERANEVRAMVQAGQTPDQAAMERFQNQFGQTLQLATQLQEQEMVRALTQLRNMTQEQAGQMQSIGFAQGEAAMNRVHRQAQDGIDDPAGFRQRYRGGRSWQEDQPVATDTPPAGTGTPGPTGTPGAGNGEQEQLREQERNQQQDGSGGQQGPNPTPDSGSGNGSGDGSGSGGSGGSGSGH